MLPPVSGGRLENKSLRAWLAQAELRREPQPQEVLARVLEVLNLPYPEQGLAALRLGGQTSDRPTHWIAAADPVYLEPRLDHLCLHSLRRVGVSLADMRSLIDHLQTTLGSDSGFGFTRLGSYAYVSAKTPFATATVPDYIVDEEIPTEFLPTGEGSAVHRNLISEIEMALHGHETNTRREEHDQPPVNSLWLWGGGTAPQQITRPQPPLFSEDALMTGYWYSATGVAEPWRGNIAACLQDSVAGFVAETPEFENGPVLLENCLLELRDALKSERLSALTLLFRDGIRADIDRSSAMRFWRRDSELFD